MNCKKCHHTSDAHVTSLESPGITKFGECIVSMCSCKQFVEPIEQIDEELI